MNEQPTSRATIRLRARPQRRPIWRRALRRAIMLKLVVLGLAGLAVGLLLLRLGNGPMELAGLSERVAGGLAERLGPGWDVSIRDTSLALLDRSLALKATGVEIRNADRVVVARAPEAIISVDTWSALRGAPQPRFVEFRDLQLKARVARDGSFTLLPQADGAAPPPPEPSLVEAPVASLPEALAYGTGAVLQPTGLIGALDQARLVNSRLTLVDESGLERVGFERVDADFGRDGAGARLDVTLRGPSGGWSFSVEARPGEDGSRAGTVRVREVPLNDLFLLGGLAHLSGASTLKMSAEADVAVGGDGVLRRLDVRAGAGPGQLDLPRDGGRVAVEAMSVQAAWDPARSAFAIREAAYIGGGDEVRLTGEVVEEPGRAWRMTLAGRDGRLAGASPTDRPIGLDRVALAARGTASEVVVEQLELKGPEVDAAIALSYGGSGDGGGVRFAVRGGGGDARAVLRLWPAWIEPKTRAFLVGHLRRGRVTALSIDGTLTGADLRSIDEGRGMTDAAFDLAFSGRGVEYLPGEGLPLLADAELTGRITGRTLTIAAASGRVLGPDGRGLALAEGSYAIADMWPKTATGRLSLRVEGEVEALASVLNAPALRAEGAAPFDPTGLKGRADLRLDLAAPTQEPRPLSELDLTVSGRLTDVAADGVLGRERLEGATLTVAVEGGGLVLRGEGRIGGTPATIDVRHPRGQPGEAVIAMTLDEAARARRGLPTGPALAGPMPVRIVAPLSKGAKPAPARVEIDLARLAIDDLLPGWTKPAGRPGRVAFTWNEAAPEIRDLQLEAGPVQIRGNATLNAEGALERAELSTFKLSPGDDLRLSIERAGNVHRVTARGNTADARPFLRHLREPASARGAKEGGDLDLDVQVNILTGHNDEALTRTALKATVRGRELRDAEVVGRFTGSSVIGRVVRQGGASVFVLESGDAGATLRFADVYRRMAGGDMSFQMGLGGARQPGFVRVRNFVLRNEPALGRIIAQQPQSAGAAAETSGNAPGAALNASEVGFTRARTEFIRTGTRIDLQDAVISGPQVGFTLSGWVDQARDTMDVSGTFVPAYGLNNVFAQVPLIGPILGGGSNEGLFAVNFRVSGKASVPTLTVNPLSAIAPGIFRKLFGAGQGDANAPQPLVPER